MDPKPGAPYKACLACWRTCCLACCGCLNCAPPALAKANCKIFAVERCGATTGACCCSFSSSDKARSMTFAAIAAAAYFFWCWVHQAAAWPARKITRSKFAHSRGWIRLEVCTTHTCLFLPRSTARADAMACSKPLSETQNRTRSKASEPLQRAPETYVSRSQRKFEFV